MSNSLSVENYKPQRGDDGDPYLGGRELPFIDKEAPLITYLSDVGLVSHLLVMKPFGKHGRDAS